MKKLRIFFYTSLLVPIAIGISYSPGFAQSWQWGETGYGPLKVEDNASPVATDKDGNAYITGQYYGTVIFGNDTLTNISYNAYLTKYNSSGNVQWARQIIDSGGSSGNGIATDKLGNIYITGNFWGFAHAGPYTLTPDIHPGLYNTFIIKYDPNGNVLWAKQSTQPINAYNDNVVGNSTAADNNNNVYITGYFSDRAIFGTDTLKANTSSSDLVFLVKYDSNGNKIWAKQSAGADSNNYTVATSVTADKYGNAYITGYFYDTVSFGATTLYAINTGSPNAFLVKYSAAGNVIWAKQSTNGSLSSLSTPNAVITDRGGYPYITGYFEDIVKFGTHPLYSPGAASIFLAKYDTGGNAIWARQSSPGWEGSGLSSDENNYIYMSGVSYNGNSDSLRFSYYSLPTNPWANSAGFIMKFDTTGHPICGSILNNLSSYYNTLNGVASDPTGTYIYTASTFKDTVICGPDTLIPRGGGGNIFAGRWINCNSADGIPTITTKSGSVSVYPNPSNGIFTFQVKSEEVRSKSIVEVYNMLGEKVYTLTLPSPIGEGASAISQINLSAQPNGIYLYRAIHENGSLVGDGKLVIEK